MGKIIEANIFSNLSRENKCFRFGVEKRRKNHHQRNFFNFFGLKVDSLLWSYFWKLEHKRDQDAPSSIAASEAARGFFH